MKSPGTELPKTCLLFESHLWHEEVFPQWVHLLNRLGYYVVIHVRAEVMNRDSMPWYSEGEYHFKLWEFGTPLETEGYDLLVINTVSGYMTPGLEIMRLEEFSQVNIPTICYIHEPLFWLDKFPLRHLTIHLEAGTFEYDHCRDGTYIPGGGLISDIPLMLAEDLIEVWVEKRLEMVYFMPQDGVWKAKGIKGHAEFGPWNMDLSEFLAGPDRAAFVCTPHSRELMQARFPSVGSLMPLFFGDLPVGGERRHYKICGEIDFNRKDYSSLINAAEELKLLGDDQVVILGGNRRSDVIGMHEGERILNEAIEEKNLQDRIVTTGYLDYRELFLELSTARFILPLVDRDRDGGSYFTKLTAAVAFSLAFGVPMVIDEELAALYGLEFMPTYAKRDLASGIAQARALSDAEYEALSQRILARRDELREENFAALRDFVENLQEEAVSG